MNWEKQILKIEEEFGFHKEKNWKPVIDSVNKLLTEYPDDVELYIRAIYLLHNILVEEEYPNEEQNKMTHLLQKWFNQSKEKFSENAAYLFFIGKILHIAEWYFGLEDTELALEFQKKAMQKEPDNLLYEWAYLFSHPKNALAGYIAHKIIEYDKGKVSWLKSKGFPGAYALEHLKMSDEEYKKQNKQ